MHRIWSSPFMPLVRGGLRGKINQYSDPSGNILTPKQPPLTGKRKDFRVIPIDPEVEPDPDPVCIPPDPSGIIFQTGGSDPLTLGENIVVQENGSTGITGPVVYQWFKNGVAGPITATYSYTVIDGDIVDKDEFGLGGISFTVVVANPCGQEVYSGAFAAQGTPP